MKLKYNINAHTSLVYNSTDTIHTLHHLSARHK